MHKGAEVGIDEFQAMRSPDERYRTAPLGGLWTHQKGGFYHDGRFATMLDVVNHYDGFFKLGLTGQEKGQRVEFMKSLPSPTTAVDVTDPTDFVTQHYRDFLGREPDAPGLAFWVNEIESCGASAAFFLSIEFQETGYLAYKTYTATSSTPRWSKPSSRRTSTCADSACRPERLTEFGNTDTNLSEET